MNTPQSAIIPEDAQAGIFMEARILKKAPLAPACLALLETLNKLQKTYPEQELGLTIAFGADFWHSLNHDEGKELFNFKELGSKYKAPATQKDLMFHIQSKQHNLNIALGQEIITQFVKNQSIKIESETHGFRLLENRGYDGFVDGTENPHEPDEIKQTAIISEGKDAGGSYVLLQKYQHHLRKWSACPIKTQEDAIGRQKESDIEFEEIQKNLCSHLKRVNLKENGIGLKIVRRSLPYGTLTGEHGLMFIAYAAHIHNIHSQLLHMFGESEDKKTDLLLEHLSTAISGAYYYAPSLERLKALFD